MRGLMFFTSLSVSLSVSLSICQFVCPSICPSALPPSVLFFVSTTPFKPLHRIKGIFRTQCEDVRFTRKLWFCYFSGNFGFFELRIWPYITYNEEQFVSATPLKTLHGILWNFVDIEDTMWGCAYYQEIKIPLFFWKLWPFWT